MAGPPLGCGCSLARLHPVRVGVTHAHQAHQSTSSCPSSRSEEKEGWPLGHHEVGAGVSRTRTSLAFPTWWGCPCPGSASDPSQHPAQHPAQHPTQHPALTGT